MAANQDPIYSRTADVQVGGSNTIGGVAQTVMDGSSNTTNAWVIFTADPTEGGFVQKVILKPINTVAASVARIFYCQAAGAFTLGTTNAANNTALIGEITLPSWTVSQTSASPQFELPVNFPMPANTKLLIMFGTSVGATNGYSTVVVGGKY